MCTAWSTGVIRICMCYVDDKVSKVAWLNRSNIIYAGQDKWSLDPRVSLASASVSTVSEKKTIHSPCLKFPLKGALSQDASIMGRPRPSCNEVDNAHLEYSLRIQQVDVYDEGSYTCSIQTKQQPKTSQVYLIVQGKWHLHIDTSSTQHTTNPRQPYRFTLGNDVNILYSKQKLEQI
ncbi:hypothetical protein JOQ06_007115 [Pogonophryne albipinna]|uniref:Ig-like domain-containing protein n=1 Tax=Pogonophryne albipinna TaxID=1090488 RepID=A0AAD6B075_9TELE|nr:hypothetical protein JOQ06_007115 [Pogonophryne albipinna]